MPSLSPLLWQAEQNVKIPSLSHWMSFRVQLNAANVSQTVAIPTSQTNPAQAVFPGIAPTGQPQVGRVFFCTHLVVRSANGAIGGTAGGSVTLQDTTSGQPVAVVNAPTTPGQNPPYIVSTVATGTATIAPNDSLAIIYTAPSAGTATATGFTVDIMGYWQQGI